jgi:hypothetical protein
MDGDLSPFATTKQLTRFNRSIHHPGVLGLEACHAVSNEKPPPDPMDMDEAKRFIEASPKSGFQGSPNDLDGVAVRAWRKYIRTDAVDARWVNDGSPISREIPLRKRELFGLIILAYLYGRQWRVGYDPDQPEPSDGLIVTGNTKICFEHKVIVEEANREVLDEILETYRKQVSFRIAELNQLWHDRTFFSRSHIVFGTCDKLRREKTPCVRQLISEIC